jgi:hypothetical protein
MFSDVCPIVVCLKQKDSLSLFAFNPASVSAILEAPAKQESLDSNDNKGTVGAALNNSQHRIVLEGRLL